jgi:hypothetical protein
MLPAHLRQHYFNLYCVFYTPLRLIQNTLLFCIKVKFSPRWHSVFLSCSADWTIGVWHLHAKVLYGII